MKIETSPEIRDKVSPSLLEFIKIVLDKEQLNSWDVHIWACRCEGECDNTTIMFGLCETEMKTKLLFLHESAHALRNSIDWDDSYWHRDGWAKEFDRLCREHLR